MVSWCEDMEGKVLPKARKPAPLDILEAYKDLCNDPKKRAHRKFHPPDRSLLL